MRLPAVDAARGLAVVLMFMHHFPKWLSTDPESSFTYSLLVFISRLSAPLFILVVGVCMVLSSKKRAKETGEKKTIEHLIRRGMTLIAAGFVLNLIIYEKFFDLNVLHTIGLTIILLAPTAIKPTTAKIAVSFAVIAAASELAAKTPVMEAFQFPPLPWTLFAVMGLFLGCKIAEYAEKGEMEKMPMRLEMASIASLASAFLFGLMKIPFETSPATWTFMAIATAFMLYALAVFIWVCGWQKGPQILRPLIVYGKYAFFLYFTHHIFVVTLPGQLGLLNKLSVEESVACMLIFLLASWLILERVKFKAF